MIPGISSTTEQNTSARPGDNGVQPYGKLNSMEADHLSPERSTSKTPVDTCCLLEFKAHEHEENRMQISVHDLTRLPAAALIADVLQTAGYTVRRHEAGWIAIVGGQTR